MLHSRYLLILLSSRLAHAFHAEWPPYLVTKCNLWSGLLEKGTVAEAFERGLEPCPWCEKMTEKGYDE